MVQAKKSLGQHFLHDEHTAQRIVDTLTCDERETVLEIGPGTGVLSKYLLQRFPNYFAIDIDRESIEYLHQNYPNVADKFQYGNILRYTFEHPLNIIGNFPYNISSQILFQVYENAEMITQVVGMFQKEVAERVSTPHGSKTYGILSVLLQSLYDIDYQFTVAPGAFSPPPKVKSGVIKLVRRTEDVLVCDRNEFKSIVKMAFNQRRKTLRNSLRSKIDGNKQYPYMDKRPEQLSWQQFDELAQAIIA